MYAPLLLAGTRFESARHVDGGPTHGHSFRTLARADSSHTDSETLRDELLAATAPLDYTLINDALADAGDLGIARYLVDSISCPVAIALASAPSHGVLVENGDAMCYLNTGFEAAHQLPHVPPGHKCGRLHGHGFGVRLVADATVTRSADLELAWQPLYEQLNHHYLNDLPGLANPTSEVMAQWLYQRLFRTLPGLKWVEVRETHSAGSQFDGKRFRIWKEQRFESAVPFDDEGNYTGHSYLIRLMLAGNLDQTMGWLIDFGDVKDRFRPIYRQLDHNPLDRLSGIRNGSLASVAEWTHAHLAPLVPELARIDLMENPGCGISLPFADDMRWPLLLE